jgi:DNA-binding MarR family transcriptional regulator
VVDRLGQGRHSNDLAHRLQRLVLQLNRELRAQNAGAGASNADAMLLAEVRHSPGLGVSELAAIENVARSVMSERVKRLQVAGLVAGDPALHQDRRRVGLVITDNGRALLETITAKRRDWMAERLATLSPSEREAVQVAVESLERIIGQRTGTAARPPGSAKIEGERT